MPNKINPLTGKFDYYKNPSTGAGTGDVTGAASATDSSVVLFDGTTGKVIKEATGVTHDTATKTTTWEDIGVFGPKGTRVSPDGIEMWDDFKGTGTLQIGFAEDGAPRFDVHGGLQVDDTAVFADTVFAADFQLTNPTEGQPPAMIQFNAPTGQVAVDQKFLAATEATLNGEVLDGEQTYVQITQNGIKQWKLAGGSSFDIEADPTGPLRIGANGTIISEGLAGYPDMSAILDLNTTYRGFLPPRLTTTQRNAISSPATGLMIYNTTTNTYQGKKPSAWEDIGGGGTGTSPSYFRREQADTVTTYSATNTSDTDSDGNWKIVKEVVSGVTRNLLSVYTATAAWTNRASATYTLSKTYNLAL